MRGRKIVEIQVTIPNNVCADADDEEYGAEYGE